MADYIKRDTAYNYLTEYYNHRADIQHQNLRKALNAIPAEDVVPVVRCKDCIHRPKSDGFGDDYVIDYACPYICDDDYYSRMPDNDWFCNHGERMGGGT